MSKTQNVPGGGGRERPPPPADPKQMVHAAATVKSLTVESGSEVGYSISWIVSFSEKKKVFFCGAGYFRVAIGLKWFNRFLSICGLPIINKITQRHRIGRSCRGASSISTFYVLKNRFRYEPFVSRSTFWWWMKKLIIFSRFKSEITKSTPRNKRFVPKAVFEDIKCFN